MRLAAIGNEYWMVDDVSGDPLFYVGPAQAPPQVAPQPFPPFPGPRGELAGGPLAGLQKWWQGLFEPREEPLPPGTITFPSKEWPFADWWSSLIGPPLPPGTVTFPTKKLPFWSPEVLPEYAQPYATAYEQGTLQLPSLPPITGMVSPRAAAELYRQAQERDWGRLLPEEEQLLGQPFAQQQGAQVWGAARPGAGAYAPESDIYAGEYGRPLAPAPTDGEGQYTPLAVLNAQAQARAAAAAQKGAAQGWQKEWPNPPTGYRLPDPGRPGQYRSQAETETWWQAFRAQHKGVDPITWYASNPLNIRPGVSYEPSGPLSGYQAAALQSAQSDWDWAQGILDENIRMGRGAVGPSPGEWQQHWYEARGRPTPEQEQELDWARGEAYQAQRAAAEAAERQAREAERRFREAALPYTSTRWDRW